MPTPIKNLSREDRNTLTSIIKMATYLTGQTCEVVGVRHAISPGLTRYTVKVPRSKVPLAVAPGAKTISLGLHKLADVLTTKTLRKLHEGIKIVGKCGTYSPYLRDEVARVAAENLPSSPAIQ